MAAPSPFDDIDMRILQELQREAQVTNIELARRIGLSPPSTLRRVRALEQAGAIRQYVAILDPALLGLSVTVFVQIKLERQSVKRLRALEEAILERPEILECHVVSGEADFLLRVVVPDMAAYERFHRDFLVRVAGVSSTVSSVALKHVKDVVQLPLEALASQRKTEPKGQTPYRIRKKPSTRSGAPDGRAGGTGGRSKTLDAASSADRSHVA